LGVCVEDGAYAGLTVALQAALMAALAGYALRANPPYGLLV
jgi:hypothetical protein